MDNRTPADSGPKKRLCIMIPGHWSRIMGGSQYQIKCLIEALRKLDRYEIYCLTRDCSPEYKPEGYQLIQYKYPGSLKRGTHRHFIEMMLLPRILKKINPDIIYQRVGCSQTGIAARYATKKKCNMVWHVASEYDLTSSKFSFSRLVIERAVDRWFLNCGIQKAKHIVVQTEDQGKLLEKYHKRSPTSVVRNFHPSPVENLEKTHPVKIVWVSNLKDLKQPELFIRLAKKIQSKPEIEFKMVGAIQGGKRKQQHYRSLFAETGNLEYAGAKTQEEVNQILSASHIFVNTSRREGFPNTFIQAWMRQMPVVSLRVDPDRLIEKNDLGFVSRSFDQLVKDVLKLAQDHALRKQMGINAREFALKNFSIKNIEKLLTLFK